MTQSPNQYEHTLREDMIRLGVTAVITIIFLTAATMLQARTGFMNALIVLPQESVETTRGEAGGSPSTTPLAAPAAQLE